MFIIGLTGGIAAGKSTVAECWESLGGVQIDADAIAKQVVEPGTPGLAAVVAQFGREVLSANGELDRKSLAQIVFADPQARAKLESIVHPLVKAEAKRQLALQDPNSMVIYNVPLLVEASVDLPFDTIVTVEAPVNDQIERMVTLRGLTPEQAAARIRAQATPAQRANRADHILNSNQDLRGLIKDAKLLWKTFERQAAAKEPN